MSDLDLLYNKLENKINAYSNTTINDKIQQILAPVLEPLFPANSSTQEYKYKPIKKKINYTILIGITIALFLIFYLRRG